MWSKAGDCGSIKTLVAFYIFFIWAIIALSCLLLSCGFFVMAKMAEAKAAELANQEANQTNKEPKNDGGTGSNQPYEKL